MKGKLMKVFGRSKVTVLAVVVAVVLVGAPAALAANGKPFILGKAKNVATKATGLVGKVGGGAAAMLVKNTKGGPALDLQVGNADVPANDVAPMKVNSNARVDNLNAQFAGQADNATNAQNADNAGNLGGQPASAYQKRVDGTCPSGTSIRAVNESGTVLCNGTANLANNADKLDNKDSTTFGIKTDHAKVLAHDCDTLSVWNECAPVTVTVPSNRNYIVSVWSSFSARMPDGTTQTIDYCSGGKGPSIDPGNPCITPFAVQNAVSVDNRLTAASSSGDTLSLAPGTYTFFTAIRPPSEFQSDSKGHVITKVMVRDITNTL